MTYDRKILLMPFVAILAMAVLAEPSIAQKGKSPGGVTGEGRFHPGTWPNQRASRSMRHARTYSRDIYRYSRDAGRIDPSVTKTESEELGRNITKSQKDLNTARKEAGDDAETLAAIKSIEKHLASAADQHKMLHQECCKDSVDGGVCMKHCNQILLELDNAQAEHNALMRSMEMKSMPPDGSPAPRQNQ